MRWHPHPQVDAPDRRRRIANPGCVRACPPSTPSTTPSSLSSPWFAQLAENDATTDQEAGVRIPPSTPHGSGLPGLSSRPDLCFRVSVRAAVHRAPTPIVTVSVGGRRAVAHRRGGHGWPSPGCRRVASGRGSRQRSSAGSALSSGSCRLSRCWRQTETTWSIDLSPPGSTTRWSLPPRTAPRGCNAKHRDRLLTRNASCGTWYAGQPAFTRRSDRWHSTMRHAQAKPAAQRRRMVR